MQKKKWRAKNAGDMLGVTSRVINIDKRYVSGSGYEVMSGLDSKEEW